MDIYGPSCLIFIVGKTQSAADRGHQDVDPANVDFHQSQIMHDAKEVNNHSGNPV